MQGRPDSADFAWTLRVYYEDTDAGGIVYYANYLKFFERCRTEWLRSFGVDQDRLAREHRVQFVVTAAAVQYLRSARLDDRLTVLARVARLGGASIEFEQSCWRNDELLATGQVKVACVDAQTLAPARLPSFLRASLTSSNSNP